MLADGDGVVVMPADGAEQIIADVEEVQRIEKAIGEGMRGGGSRSEMFKNNPRLAHISAYRSGGKS